MDFFDDFDWEDMAMAGSLSEEMAAEEREQRRLEKEAERMWDDDIPEDCCDRRASSFFGNGPRAKRPFEQYVDDHIRGWKKTGDPMFSPSRSVRGEASTRSTIWGVPVHNAHLVSEKFLQFVFMALKANPGHEVRAVYFNKDGGPVVEGRPVFGIFEAGSRTVHINLLKHLENAIYIAEHPANCFSIRHTLWHSMQEVFLHEIKHALDTAENSGITRLDKSEQDRIAREWAGEVLTILAMNYDVEPPPLAEEPYFGPAIVRHLDQAIETGNWNWAKRQKQRLAEGILYQDPFFNIYTEKEYYTLSSAGLVNDERGKKLNSQVTLGLELFNQAWARAEMNAHILREAVATKTRVRVEYLSSEGNTIACVIMPAAMKKKGPFLWVDAMVEPQNLPAEFRVDRIADISMP